MTKPTETQPQGLPPCPAHVTTQAANDIRTWSYDVRSVGRPIVAVTPNDVELELDVRMAQARMPKDPTPAEWEAARRHIRVVQIATLLPDGSELLLDLPAGEARSLAAVLTAAADQVDGVR